MSLYTLLNSSLVAIILLLGPLLLILLVLGVQARVCCPAPSELSLPLYEDEDEEDRR